MKITPSLLFDYLNCPHKVWRDKHGPQKEKSQDDNPFLQLLWERGVQHERQIIENFGQPFVDLSDGTLEERAIRTSEELKKGTAYIYQGVIQSGVLFGIPDLLEQQPDGFYYPIDIKSGSAVEADEDGDGRQKKHYAVQLCLYNEILSELGFCKEKKGFIIDRSGARTEYDLMVPMGVRTPISFWDFYLQIKKEVSLLIGNDKQNNPALSTACKMCAWHDSCKTWCAGTDDLTQIFNVGRKVRDVLKVDLGISTIKDFIVADKIELLKRKKDDKSYLMGVGEATLTTAMRRGTLLKSQAEPIAYSKTAFPSVAWELFFDIEDDPTQEFVYLHGVYVRSRNGEEFRHFTSKDFNPESEKEAWRQFWAFIDSLPPNDFAVYYYSQHEHTSYRQLQKRYPEIISEEKLAAFFANPYVIDLYQVVIKTTDWPLSSYGIKALATYCGFKWRDETPSGALSIQWFNEYLKSKDEDTLRRILEYNEDDCKATLVVKDKLVAMQAR